jgi:presequence protease
MLNRSYANFMNAFTCIFDPRFTADDDTAQDNTFYPFATTNPTDYGNLRSVYLDATLDPLLRELDFRQEGWRLEHVDPRDPSTPITFKGVVFNEMKGVLSDAGSLYFEEFQKHMYPYTIYGHNSGGNPLHIPNLTFTELKSFHNQHYHPSNAKIFTYGIALFDSGLIQATFL